MQNGRTETSYQQHFSLFLLKTAVRFKLPSFILVLKLLWFGLNQLNCNKLIMTVLNDNNNYLMTVIYYELHNGIVVKQNTSAL